MVRKLIIAAAALAAVGCAGAVVADNIHTLHLTLPDGSAETITYVGDTPPKVSFAGGAPAPIGFAPMADPFAADPVFAQMDRMAAEMDARAAAMMRAADAMSVGGRGLAHAGLGALPPGVTGYSVVSTFSGGKSCVRTTEYRTGDDGGPAKVLTSASQGCGEDATAAKGAPAPVANPVAPRPAPATPVGWDGPRAPTQVRD